MPFGGSCDHRACEGNPSGCKMLTPEELEPGPEDLELAKQLIAEDWRQISSKHRMVAKLTIPAPIKGWRDLAPIKEWRDLVRPELHELIEEATFPGVSYTGDDIFEAFRRGAWHNEKWVERKTLTVKQFQAFKKLNGHLGMR